MFVQTGWETQDGFTWHLVPSAAAPGYTHLVLCLESTGRSPDHAASPTHRLTDCARPIATDLEMGEHTCPNCIEANRKGGRQLHQ